MRPPAAYYADPVLSHLVREFSRRVNSVQKPAGTRLSSWWRNRSSNEDAHGQELSQHLAALAADFVSPNSRALVAAFQRAGLQAIYHNAGSGWHVHVQAYPRGFIARLIAARPHLAGLLGLRARSAAPAATPPARTIFT